MNCEEEFLELLLSSNEQNVKQLVLKRLEQFEKKKSVLNVAIARMPAICLTIVLELAVGIVVFYYQNTIKSHPEIVGFMPLLSSVCGNIGLLSSASSQRNLKTIQIWNELQIAAVIGTSVGLVLLFLITFYTFNFHLALAVSSSILFSTIVAAFLGSISPFLISKFKLDHTVCAGPFETALEDLFGITIFLSICTLL